MDRLTERLTPQVLQRDVNRADRLDLSALTAEIARQRVELFADLYRLIGAAMSRAIARR
jgi:hypothetical protein